MPKIMVPLSLNDLETIISTMTEKEPRALYGEEARMFEKTVRRLKKARKNYRSTFK